MNSSMPTRAKIPKQRLLASNSKQTSKSELKQEISKEDNDKKKKKQRSSSLNKEEKARESPLKSQSGDRSSSNRYLSQNAALKVLTKKSVADNKKSDIVKNITSSTRSRNQNTNKRKDPKAHNFTNKLTKSSEKSSKLSTKGSSGKTNVQIAKSFVKNATSKKEIKSSEKLKSNVVPDQELERPRTSTIHKGVTKNDLIFKEINEKEIGSKSSFEQLELTENYIESKSADEDDDKVSYEEDFEEYDSDFEESDSDSTSVSETSNSRSDNEEEIPNQSLIAIAGNKFSENPKLENTSFSGFKNITIDQKHELSKTKNDKAFLRMSDRSFLTSEISSETSIEKKHIKPSHSFINFASAVEQEKEKKCKNRVLKRATDLLEMITLNEVTFHHVDIPPMNYDIYIRFFGRKNTKQVFVQTENVEDEEIQTDYIQMINKWTQNPSYDNFGCGGDASAIDVTGNIGFNSLFQPQNIKLSSFLQNSSKVILTILKEDYSVSSQVQVTKKRNELFYSDGYFSLLPLEFLKDIPVLNVYCSSQSSNYILTIFDGIVKVPETDVERGIICVWNILNFEKPEHILISHGQPTCATFDPSGNSIVIAGMVDGSTLLWDLSNNVQGDIGGSLSLKIPTYSTAVILGKENHHSYIVAIQASGSYSKYEFQSMSLVRQDDSKNFHVLTLEDTGILNIWIVVEVLKPDFSGLDTDLGLSPGGKLRLVRSSSIFLYDINALEKIQKINIRTFDFRLVPNDSNRILVTTDAGFILHVNRQGETANPKFYSGDLDFLSEVRCIDCSPHTEDLFLVGCSDGSAKLYNLKLTRPILVFPLAAKGDPLTLIQWSPIHPAIFIVLSSSSKFHLWNLMEESHHPINSYHFTDSRVTWFCFSSSYTPSQSQESSEKNVHMFISRDDGEIEVHIFKHVVIENEYATQLEYMKSL